MKNGEGPVLDSSGTRPVLHLAETGHARLVECYRFTVENHMMVGEIGCQRLELRIFSGDVAASSGPQSEIAAIRVDEHTIAVPLALERPLRRLELLDRPFGRQHGREITCVRTA